MPMTPLNYLERIGNVSQRSIDQIDAEAAEPTQCSGFSLIEVLVALAISSVIIVTTATLIHVVAKNFDRGARAVDAADRLVMALERLDSDFGSARFVVWKTASGAALAFRGEQADGEKPTRVVFVGDGSIGSGLRRDELISLTVERSGDITRLVRRRAAWAGPDASIEQAPLGDAVVLIEGNLDISFLFGNVESGGGLVWSKTWFGETTLPRFVRLILRDRATGSDPVGEADFIVHADVPLACGRADAGLDCVSHVLPAARPRASLQGSAG
jgi:prepilin-type N-terminal cleavage/methylation domain-containing protein